MLLLLLTLKTFELLQGKTFLLPDEGLTSAKKTKNAIYFTVQEMGEIRVRPSCLEWVLLRSK